MSYPDRVDEPRSMHRMMGETSPSVGLFSAMVPRELLYALGCTPVRVFPTAGKPTAAEAYLPRNFCALTRLILASFLEDGASSNLDAVIFADEDDAARRLHDVWHAYMPVPVWGFVEVPRAAIPLAPGRYADILTRTAADLETRTGKSLNTTALHQAIALYNEQRNLLAELKRRWLAGSVNTTAYRQLRRMALTQDPVTANKRLAGALEDAERGEKDSSTPSETCRLLLLAELAAPAGLVRLVEVHGARVVAEDSDLDERDLAGTVPAEAGTVEEALAALADAYLSKPPGPRMRDLPRRLAYLSQLVGERNVQAAICAYGKFCDLYLAEYPSLQAHLEGLGVPLLLLELEDETISGQHRTRVEAFLEMMSAG
jgi:benzoyl-CoA reductase/2-hydroxyglutaryl-CoA dehydratase subunit BcrC/BadD/HgdB